mgnify:CR=1 FL=1|jgi:hypothetical protein
MIKWFTLFTLLVSGISTAAAPDYWRLRYDKTRVPLIDAEIAGRYHTLEIDTGSGEGLHLYKPDLDQLIASPGVLAASLPPTA